jgi:16S rRNA processing protein RimM
MGQERILVGTIGAAHGLKGEVKVNSFTEDPAAIASYGPLHIEGRAQELRIQRLRHANAALIVQFEGIDDRTVAQSLKGARLYVARAQLPPLAPDVYYHSDLVGLAVVAGEERLGQVRQIVNFGGGDLLEVDREGSSVLVPFAGAKVDLTARSIAVELPDGFLEDGE